MDTEKKCLWKGLIYFGRTNGADDGQRESVTCCSHDQSYLVPTMRIKSFHSRFLKG